MLRQLWGRITGADKRLTVPDQQASVNGRVGDYTIIYPYGLYCDLPDNVYMKEVGRGALIPTTVERPDDHERGDIVLFHPVNKTRLILRNNGDIDIIGNGQDININNFNDMNIDLSGDMNINTPTGSVLNNGTNISDTHIHSQGNDSDGDSEIDTGYPHS